MFEFLDGCSCGADLKRSINSDAEGDGKPTRACCNFTKYFWFSPINICSVVNKLSQSNWPTRNSIFTLSWHVIVNSGRYLNAFTRSSEFNIIYYEFASLDAAADICQMNRCKRINIR